jgi:malate synthase
MVDRISAGGLQVAKPLYDFIQNEALPGSGVDATAFWDSLGKLIHDLAPKNRALLAKREELQKHIDDWHKARRGQPHDHNAYVKFLGEIGYLVPEGADFNIDTPDGEAFTMRCMGLMQFLKMAVLRVPVATIQHAARRL